MAGAPFMQGGAAFTQAAGVITVQAIAIPPPAIAPADITAAQFIGAVAQLLGAEHIMAGAERIMAGAALRPAAEPLGAGVTLHVVAAALGAGKGAKDGKLNYRRGAARRLKPSLHEGQLARCYRIEKPFRVSHAPEGGIAAFQKILQVGDAREFRGLSHHG